MWRCRQVRLVLLAVTLALVWAETAHAQVFGAIAGTIMRRIAERTVRNSMLKRVRERAARMRLAAVQRAARVRAAVQRRLSRARNDFRSAKDRLGSAGSQFISDFKRVKREAHRQRKSSRTDPNPARLRSENQPRINPWSLTEKARQIGQLAGSRLSAMRQHYGHGIKYAQPAQMLY